MKKKITQTIQDISNLHDLIYLLNHVVENFNPKITITEKQINYFLVKLNEDAISESDFKHPLYSQFKIPKKSGGLRIIHAPNDSLKILLKSIDLLLRESTTPHHRAFGFVNQKSIVDNAKIHVGKNYVYNIDLKDFFHSFDIQQVKWEFYNSILNSIENTTLRENLSYTLASIVTYTVNGKRTLPQGSPSSPSITNMLCYRLDKKLYRLAKLNGAEFSRYADDISFSANHNIFQGPFLDELFAIIRDENLEINPKKTRLQRANERQEVTGLTVNQDVNVSRKYIKELRHFLYLCERYGTEKAQIIIQNNYSKNQDNVEEKKLPNLELFLKGKLNYLSMVKCRDHSTYLKLEERYHNIFPKKISLIKSIINTWQNKGIEEAIKWHLFKLKTKSKKIENDFFTSHLISEVKIGLSFLSPDTQKEINDKVNITQIIGREYYNYATQNFTWNKLLEKENIDDKDYEFFKLIHSQFKLNNIFSIEDLVFIFKYWKTNKEFLRIDKFLFFALLINHESITKGERLIVHELWMKELGVKISQEKKDLSNTSDLKKTYEIYKKHNPKEMISFLYKFSSEDQYKWFTHNPDFKKDEITFLSKLKGFQDEKLPFNINYATNTFIKSFFLKDPNLNDRLNIFYPIFSSNLTYSNDKIISEIRKGINPFDIAVDGHHFVDVITRFKHAIEFRPDRDKLKFNTLVMEFISDKLSIDYNEAYTDDFKKYAKSLSTYIDVNNFFRGLNLIITEWLNKYKSISNRIIINLEHHDNYYILCLFHQGSSIPHNPNSPKMNGLAGDLNTLRKYWFSIVDFEIHADFTENKKPYKIECLNNQSIMTAKDSKLSKCTIKPLQKTIDGVKYVIKIYKNN